MKKILALVLALTLVLGLVACGGEDKPTDPKTDGSEPVAEGKYEEGAKLVYWPMWAEAEPQGIALSQAIEAFTEETGIEVEINWGGSRDTRKTLQPALDGGTVIDIFDEDIERVNVTWADYLLDIQKMYDESEINGKLNETLMKVVKDLGGGSLKTIPYQPSTFVVMYNKGAFEKANISAIPTNKEELFAACDALKAAGYKPFTIDDAYMAAFFGYIVDRVAGSEAAAKIVEGDFSNPAVLKAAQVIEEMIKAGYIDERAAANIFPAGQGNIADESVAMVLCGTWLPNEIRNQTAEDFKWGAFALPNLAEGGDGAESNNFGAQCFGINKNTKYPKAAFALVQWLTSGEADQNLADATLGVPMANDATWPEAIADAKEIINNTTNRLPWAVGMENDSNINACIKTNLAKMITGELDAQGFADAFAQIVKG